MCATANTHGSRPCSTRNQTHRHASLCSAAVTLSSMGHVVSTKWGKRVCGFITDPHGCLIIQPTTSPAIVHNDVSPALARQVRRDRGYIIKYIFEGSAVPTRDPHVWPLIMTRHVKCISVAYMGICQYRSKTPRHVQYGLVWIYVIYSDVYGYM